jgi:hypothetical protein
MCTVPMMNSKGMPIKKVFTNIPKVNIAKADKIPSVTPKIMGFNFVVVMNSS